LKKNGKVGKQNEKMQKEKENDGCTVDYCFNP
jgi:hypothetical protein